MFPKRNSKFLDVKLIVQWFRVTDKVCEHKTEGQISENTSVALRLGQAPEKLDPYDFINVTG